MARDLWHGLIVAADDQGRMLGIPANVRSQVWPLDDVKLDDVERCIQQLADQGMIVVYRPSQDQMDDQMDNKMVIQVVKWWTYQDRQWAGRSELPPPDGWVDRIRFNGPKRKIVQENWDKPGGFVGGMTISRPDGQPSQDQLDVQLDDQLDDHLKTGVRSQVLGNRRIPTGPDGPVNLPGWMELVKKEKNKPAALKQMIETLHPDLVEFPDFGYIGKVAKQVGGAGRLASLIWETSSKNVTGDLMAYCLAMAKGKTKAEQPASFAAIKEFAEEA
jgi:hypothetical protein